MLEERVAAATFGCWRRPAAERQAAQQDAVDDAEHRGRQADAEGQGKNRGGAMPRGPGEDAESEAEAAQEIAHAG
jgi:hypothetical protein